jgi:DNA invertase Pin-like site-specific DNA recombinase
MKRYSLLLAEYAKKGRSGLGIEAQRETLRHFAQAEGFEVAREFVEVETGKGADALDRRPQLRAALTAARKQRCHVAVAKLDRLSRDVHFISGLMVHKGRSWSQNLDRTLILSCCTCSPHWSGLITRSM